MKWTIAVVMWTMLTPGWVRAQDPDHLHADSPYAGWKDREIKALSADEVRGLLEGEGMGLALAAELNGYPGPKHVLELADALALTPQQLANIQAIRDAMLAQARRLGAAIVERERALDSAFVTKTIAASGLLDAVDELASLRGRLRAAHLTAHLGVTAELTEHQRHLYAQLRGYGSPGAHSPR